MPIANLCAVAVGLAGSQQLGANSFFLLLYTLRMEVHLSPKQEQELAQLASRKGRQAKELAEEVLGFYLQHEARFVDAVRRGLASADNGQLIEHEEVLARIDRLFRSSVPLLSGLV